MQTIVGQLAPPTGLAHSRVGLWVGGDPCDAALHEEAIDVIGKPRGVTGLADDISIEGATQVCEESLRRSRIELQARGQLDEDGAELTAQPADLAEEALQGFVDGVEALLVRNRLVLLYSAI
jgi:hypothetical protein